MNMFERRDTDPAREVLGPFAAEIEAAAQHADDLAESDALEILAALAHGESVPERPATRVVQRAEER